MKIKKFNNNKLCSYKDLCYALDKEVEQTKKQVDGIKKYFKKYPLKGYCGRKLNEINYSLTIGGKIKGLFKRNGIERAKLMQYSFEWDRILIEEMEKGLRYKWEKA